MSNVENIISCMTAMADKKQAIQLSRFFKTAPEQYGHGDKFLGLRVPQTRAVVKAIKNDISLADAAELTRSEWHEVRLAGFLLTIELYRKAKRQKDEAGRKTVIDTYLALLDRGNNWDLVDLVCPQLLGDWLTDHPTDRAILRHLAKSDNLWANRVSIVSTLALIRLGHFDDVKQLAVIHLAHPHDLMHKAVGWMLREMGKRDESELLAFLDHYATRLPRTALRYALEKLSPELRSYYMALK